MFIDCECVVKYKNLKKYTSSGINVKHIGRNDAWFKKEFTDETVAKLKEIRTGLKDALKVNFLIYPASNSLWGASHIGNQIIKYSIDDGSNCAIASSKNIMELFFSWDRADLSKCIEYLQWVDVLLIDEFGTEYNKKMKENKSFVGNSFNAFIMERKRLNKPTMIASNFHAKYLQETYADEIQEVIFNNFVGLEVASKTKKKTEFDGLSVKIQRPELVKCFDDLNSLLDNTKKKKSVF
jgi:DNA replication protein DnaC